MSDVDLPPPPLNFDYPAEWDEETMPKSEVGIELFKTRQVFIIMVKAVNTLKNRLTKAVVIGIVCLSLLVLGLVSTGYFINCRSIQSMGKGTKQLWDPIIALSANQPGSDPKLTKLFVDEVNRQASKDCWPLWG